MHPLATMGKILILSGLAVCAAAIAGSGEAARPALRGQGEPIGGELPPRVSEASGQGVYIMAGRTVRVLVRDRVLFDFEDAGIAEPGRGAPTVAAIGLVGSEPPTVRRPDLSGYLRTVASATPTHMALSTDRLGHFQDSPVFDIARLGSAGSVPALGAYEPPRASPAGVRVEASAVVAGSAAAAHGAMATGAAVEAGQSYAGHPR